MFITRPIRASGAIDFITAIATDVTIVGVASAGCTIAEVALGQV
jgi:hypothetical protein